MAFTDQLGQATAKLSNIELGIGASINPSTNAPLFTGILQNRFQTAIVVQRATSQLDTVPKLFDMGTSEIFPYIVNVNSYLGTGDSISQVVAVLTLMSTGKLVTTAWQGTITTSGTVITIPILCSALSFGQQYQMAVTFRASSSKRATYTSIFRLVQ